MKTLSLHILTLAVLTALAFAAPLFGYDTIGNGFGSKWGADAHAGNGAIVTWGYMLDGTTLDPTGFPFHSAITGTSNITALRNSVDVNYGAGAFDTAIQNAFNTWSAVASVTFVGPVTDSGMPVAGAGATSPNIRIGAFQAVPGQWFQFGSSIGIGPPGPFFEDPFSGDVIFNVAGIGHDRPYQIAPGVEDVDSVDVFRYGDDVEGVFLHELGHAAIGLNHPRWAGENPDQRMMYVGDNQAPGAPFCCQSINRQLHVDDIAAAQYVYGLRGDFNRNGKVDAADYVLWRDTNGASVTAGTAADGNIDGVVNALDYQVWRDHFGEIAQTGFGEQPSFGTGSGSTVPEPNSVEVLLMSLLVFAGRGSRSFWRNLPPCWWRGTGGAWFSTGPRPAVHDCHALATSDAGQSLICSSTDRVPAAWRAGQGMLSLSTRFTQSHMFGVHLFNACTPRGNVDSHHAPA